MKKKFIIIIISAVLVFIIGGGILLNKSQQKLPYEYTTVKKQNLVQEVTVTGKVKPAQNVQLSFEKSGRVSKIFKQVGDKVAVNDFLVALDSADLSAQLEQAQAQVDLQSANLAELKKGARAEEITVAQTKVDNAQKSLDSVKFKAQTDLANLYDDVKNILNDAFLKADDAINKQTAELFADPTTDNPKLKFSVSNIQIKNDTEWQRSLSCNALQVFKTELASVSSTNFTQLDNELSRAVGYLNTITNYLSKLNEALVLSLGLEQTTLTTYQGYVNVGRTSVNTEASSVSSQKQLISAQKANSQQNIETAQNALISAQKDLALKQAPPTPEQLNAQEAQLKQAQAGLNNIQAQLAKNYLKSPISGIVSKMEAKLGEISSAQTLVVEVISEAKFQIEANIPEADIAKVKISNTAKVTLDAYGSDVSFTATVIGIEPSATIVEGVPTYKTTLQFNNENDQIKSGMTANVDILTNQRENVLTVPYRAIIDKSGEKFVKLLSPQKTITEKKVILGLRGSDGNIEITDGLNEGDNVITFEATK